MSISPVSNNSNSYLTPINNNNEVKQLEKAKSQMQNQITTIKESKLDDKTKQEKVKALQEQISQIDMEIQAKKAEKLNVNQNNGQQKSNTQPIESGYKYDINPEGMTDLISAKATYSKAQIMNGVKNHLHSDARILKKEIETDESRSASGSTANVKRQELEEIESREKILSKKTAETNKTVQNQVEEASRQASESESNDIDNAKAADENAIYGSLKQNITTEGSSKDDK